jgi:hypothetical protein
MGLKPKQSQMLKGICSEEIDHFSPNFNHHNQIFIINLTHMQAIRQKNYILGTWVT